ncbi:hypothetical protein FALBO_16381 [Fusarium albosuccineum]|uniref:Cytochrome b5 heme-binding domain-containing protein n=1 Tax=Fusarium albosuccineum TaxID=1237068 RepID=A0A8H4KKV4_9HYPO|nr:hypothetical protein FALBO_16381 [Fusarium albosuccineum]
MPSTPPTPRTYTREEVRQHAAAPSLWCIINSTIYDLTDFIQEHPGGSHILYQIAGQDATVTFYSLHRHDVLSSFSDLAIGTVAGEKVQTATSRVGDFSPVPYAEPLWLRRPFHSPYYNESHRRLQRAARVFTETYVIPEADKCERTGSPPSQNLVDLMAQQNILRMRLGPGKHLHGHAMLGGRIVEGHEFDYFHKLVLDVSTAGPPWKTKVADEVFGGVKKLCLAITEAIAGSDVTNIQTTAEKTSDGKHYVRIVPHDWSYWTFVLTFCPVLFEIKIVNGSKKWITNGTAYVTFDQVKVPVENLIGEENGGMRIIISNFNQERWAMACKRLNEHPVIRHNLRPRLAKMISLVEANQAWLESITYQMCHMSLRDQTIHLAGPIALLKRASTRMAQKIADEAVQMWGGRGLTESGMGRHISEFHRTYKFDAILGGSEEVLADIAMKQALKNFPRAML